MYRSKRAKLSSSTTLSPYQQTKRWSENNLAGLVYCVVLVIVWLVFLYILSGLIVYFGGRYWLKYWDEYEETINASMIYAKPWMEMTKWIGSIVIIIMVFHGLRKKK